MRKQLMGETFIFGKKTGFQAIMAIGDIDDSVF